MGTVTTQAVQTFLEKRPSEDRRCLHCCKDGVEVAVVAFGIYFCGGCVEVLQDSVTRWTVRDLNDIWSWSKEDLAYMKHGGNLAFQKALQEYPNIVNAPQRELRYCSKFAERYKQNLEAACLGLPAQFLPPEVAML